MTWKRIVEENHESRNLALVQGYHYFNHHVPVVLQHGPTCGIAALTALTLQKEAANTDFVSTANELLSVAISTGISSQGELMSVHYMSQLCRYAGLPHQIVRVCADTDLGELLQDSVLLMIYDKDKNNEPATKYGGERAHWLMITGFCNKPSRNSRSGVLVTSQRGNIALQPSNSYSKTRGSSTDKAAELHVFVQHGKSRLRQLWRWSDILASNETVRRAKPGTWVLPDNLHQHVAGLAVRVMLKHVQ